MVFMGYLGLIPYSDMQVIIDKGFYPKHTMKTMGLFAFYNASLRILCTTTTVFNHFVVVDSAFWYFRLASIISKQGRACQPIAFQKFLSLGYKYCYVNCGNERQYKTKEVMPRKTQYNTTAKDRENGISYKIPKLYASREPHKYIVCMSHASHVTRGELRRDVYVP